MDAFAPFAMKKTVLIWIMLGLVFGCKKDDPMDPDPMTMEPQGLSFNSGKNSYSESFTEGTRQFVIHVPITYNREESIGIVFAFHDQESSPDDYYDESGWAQKADAENFIVVYPQARNYFITDLAKTISFWIEFEADLKIQEGANIQNDVTFVEELFELVKLTFNLDEGQVFFTGHGQGGDFVKSRIITDIDNIVVASAVSSGLGVSEFLLHINKMYNPLMAILGTHDEIELEKAGRIEPFPLDEAGIFDEPYLSEQIDNILITLQLNFMGSVETNDGFTKLFYNSSTVSQNTEYTGYLVEGLNRAEADGANNRAGINAVDLFWEFFQKHKE